MMYNATMLRESLEAGHRIKAVHYYPVPQQEIEILTDDEQIGSMTVLAGTEEFNDLYKAIHVENSEVQ